ncbi:hypothetical protein [Effusibacillus lacus]|nr:hypothetical protein [Effusibacillus lacus]
MQRLGAFMVGVLVGAAALLAVKGHDLDLLYLQIRKLRTENAQLQEEITSLKKDFLDKQKQSIRKVRRIEVDVKAPDEFTKLAIARHLKSRMHPLINKELGYLESDPQLVTQLIEGRTYTYENQVYQLKVEAVFIGETLRIWVFAGKQTTGT